MKFGVENAGWARSAVWLCLESESVISAVLRDAVVKHLGKG